MEILRDLGVEPRWPSDSIEAARSETETNHCGPLRLSRAFAAVLAENGGGVIINLLSILRGFD
jgi:NAD(P)-dependent dehydrogenase (short-subunit alcohol dehydrogenase family)